MRFDEWPDDSVAGVDHGHTQMLPAGTHTGEITYAQEETAPYMVSDDNQAGRCLVVKFGKQGFYEVKVTISVTWRGKIEAVCRAAGVAPPKRGDDWDERTLIGRTVTVDVEYKQNQNGKEYARVTRWHASTQKPAEAKPKRAPARTPAAKTHAEFQERADADDIPF